MMNIKMIVTGKFRKLQKGNVSFALPFEESKEIDTNRQYTIMIIGPLSKEPEVRYNKVVIK